MRTANAVYCKNCVHHAECNAKRKMEGYKAAGYTEAYTAAKAKYNALSAKYKAFSKAAQLPEQRQRLYIAKNTQ